MATLESRTGKSGITGGTSREVAVARLRRWCELEAEHLESAESLDMLARRRVMFLVGLFDREDPERGKWGRMWEREVNGSARRKAKWSGSTRGAVIPSS